MTYFGAIIVFRRIMQHKEIGFALEYKNVHFLEINIMCKTKYLNVQIAIFGKIFSKRIFDAKSFKKLFIRMKIVL